MKRCAPPDRHKYFATETATAIGTLGRAGAFHKKCGVAHAKVQKKNVPDGSTNYRRSGSSVNISILVQCSVAVPFLS